MMRNNRSVRTLITAAGLVVGIQAAAVFAQTEVAPALPAAANAQSVIENAASLLSSGKAVQARSLLMPLVQGKSVNLSDAERKRVLKLLTNANERIKRMAPSEVSLDTAVDAMNRDDLVLVKRHADAVINSPKSTNEQTSLAKDLLVKAETRREAIAVRVPGLIDDANTAIENGDIAAAKTAVEAVTRSGHLLTPEQQDVVATLQNTIYDASNDAAMGMLQPGVVKPGRPRPKPSMPETAPAQTPTPAAPVTPAETPAPQAPAPAPKPAPAPVQTPAPASAPASEQPASPTPRTRPAPSQPEQAPAAQTPAPAPAPVAEPAPAQPASQPVDLIEQARRLEAADLLAQADEAFAANRMSEAAGKYQRVLGTYGQYLDGNARTGAEQRMAEARARLNLAPAAGGNVLDQVASDTSLLKQQTLAEFNNDLAEAAKALEADNTTYARDFAASANLKLNNGRRYFSAPEVEALAKQVTDVRTAIDKREESLRIEQAERNTQTLAIAAKHAEDGARLSREIKINEALSRVRSLQQEMKYEEALQVVDQILFLDPINPSGLVLRDVLQETIIAITAHNILQKNEYTYAMDSLENQSALARPRNILDYPEDWPRISALRGEPVAFADSPENRRALATIEGKRVPVAFNDTPFGNIIDFVKAVTQLNVDVDWQSLEAVSIDKETPVTLNLTNVPMRTVLDRVVEKVSPDSFSGAAWSIDDGVLTIASREVINKKKELVIYDIRDLLIEIPNYTNAPQFDLQSVLQSTGQGRGGGGGQSPFRENNQNPPPRRTVEDRTTDIIDIITTNVDSQGWQQNGGDIGFMQQLQGSLIVTNTPANHRAIHGLLSKLREVRALQINVETRFLLVNQNYFEQIGFDLDVYFNTDNNQVRAARATQPNFRPSSWFQENPPWSVTTGNVGTAANSVPRPSPLSVIGTPQNSLPLAESLIGTSFAADILGNAPALGVAGQFLDDIQVDFLVKATQADTRTVNLQAPRLTFTNGQTSNIYVATQVSFVSDLTPVTSDSAVGFDPTLGTVNEGVTLLVSGTISADRRYVTLDVDAATSKIDGFTTTAVNAIAGGQLVNSGSTGTNIQQPTVTVTRVRTTVTVPDQGTILLGGQRLVTESEVEVGVPVLSKLPFFGRFFSNRIESKEEQTLLILMKPTILIQNEEEERSFPGLSDSLRTPFGG